MARSIDEIQAQIQAAAVQYYAAVGITIDVNRWSRRNIIRLWTYIFAAVIAVFEQILDLFKSEVESDLAKGGPASEAWLQNEAFKFQYSATDPQVLTINNGIASYAVVREDLRIITRAAVKKTISGFVTIKVAKGTTPGPLSVAELDAFTDYINDKGTAGINYTCISTDADKLYIAGDLYYRGQYADVIQTNVKDAINAFLAALKFNGVMQVSDLVAAIKSAEGVNDFVPTNIRARKDTVPLSGASYLVQNSDQLERQWITQAGYLVEENTALNTWDDTINYISE